MSEIPEKLSGSDIPQANRLDKVIHRLQAAMDGLPGWPGHDVREVGYYTQACGVLGLLDGDGKPTDEGAQVAKLEGDEQLRALAALFAKSRVGQAWLHYGGAHSLGGLSESSCEAFLLACSDLSASTAQRRAAALGQWLVVLQPHAPKPTEGSSLPPTVMAFLNRELASDSRVPTRIRNWAARMNIATYRALLQWTPDRLAQERNLGRGSIAKVRDIIEQESGLPWNALTAKLQRLGSNGGAMAPPETQAAASPTPTHWDELSPPWTRQARACR